MAFFYTGTIEAKAKAEGSTFNFISFLDYFDFTYPEPSADKLIIQVSHTDNYTPEWIFKKLQKLYEANKKHYDFSGQFQYAFVHENLICENMLPEDRIDTPQIKSGTLEITSGTVAWVKLLPEDHKALTYVPPEAYTKEYEEVRDIIYRIEEVISDSDNILSPYMVNHLKKIVNKYK